MIPWRGPSSAISVTGQLTPRLQCSCFGLLFISIPAKKVYAGLYRIMKMHVVYAGRSIKQYTMLYLSRHKIWKVWELLSIYVVA